MDIGIIRMSSKGQIVIPASIRRGLSEGEQLLVMREGNRFILKPLSFCLWDCLIINRWFIREVKNVNFMA